MPRNKILKYTLSGGQSSLQRLSHDQHLDKIFLHRHRYVSVPQLQTPLPTSHIRGVMAELLRVPCQREPSNSPLFIFSLSDGAVRQWSGRW